MKAVRLASLILAVGATAFFADRRTRSADDPAPKGAPQRPAAAADGPPIQTTRRAECRWADKIPVLDGKLDDPCWKNAQPIERFASFWEKKQRTGTTAYLVWDADAIYYAGTMTDHELRSFGADRNDSLWNGDVFELFLKPSVDRPEYYEFQANPRGVVFEVAFPDRGRITGDFPEQPVLGSRAAVRLDGTLDKSGDRDASWTVEGRIPWSAFAAVEGRPNPGDVWSFAVCRYDYGPEGTEPVLMSSAPLTRMVFHQYEDYGKLEFVGPK